LIYLPSSIELISKLCFARCRTFSTLALETGPRISNLGEWAFSSCSSLWSICVLSSIERIGQTCFRHCTALLRFTSQSGSRRSKQEGNRFQTVVSRQALSTVETIPPGEMALFIGISTLFCDWGAGDRGERGVVGKFCSFGAAVGEGRGGESDNTKRNQRSNSSSSEAVLSNIFGFVCLNAFSCADVRTANLIVGRVVSAF
jgi:hypothetical protein